MKVTGNRKLLLLLGIFSIALSLTGCYSAKGDETQPPVETEKPTETESVNVKEEAHLQIKELEGGISLEDKEAKFPYDMEMSDKEEEALKKPLPIQLNGSEKGEILFSLKPSKEFSLYDMSDAKLISGEIEWFGERPVQETSLASLIQPYSIYLPKVREISIVSYQLTNNYADKGDKFIAFKLIP